MGVLRFWLACAVLAGHVGALGGYQWLTGQLAVQCFYMVSGFYMALVLDRKYARSAWVFLFNRITRLYPAYLALSALSLLVYFGAVEWAGLAFGPWYCLKSFWPHFSAGGKLLTAATNLFIEGKDLTVFLAASNQTAEYHLSAGAMHEPGASSIFQLLPQSWSLGLEFNFYLLSPWLVRLRLRWIFGFIGASLLVRLLLAAQGYSGDPWSYRFFPSELAVFLLGLLAYRVHQRLPAADQGWRRASRWAALALVPVLLLSHWLPWGGAATTVTTLALLALALPWIFDRTKDAALDRSLGELSYPIYLGHLMVMDALLVTGVIPVQGRWNVLPVLAATTALAWGLRRWVEKPVDRWRHRLTGIWLAQKN